MSRTPQQSRVAVVTGGGSGIGEATCHHLAAAGHRVAVLDLEAESAGRVAKAVRHDGGEALSVPADVSDRAAVEAVFSEVRRTYGPIEILVTSAGICPFAPFEEITFEVWQHTLDVNLTGTFHCCQAAITDMTAAGWGRIVMISSSSAQRGAVRAPHYAAAKAGVVALAKSLALAYAPYGITVNNIPPSGIETPMQHQGQAEGHLPANEVMASAIPLGHLGTPDDIASAVMFLVSEAAGFVTGQTFGVNGGQVL
jgi:2-hydroxycyclohexanecarboxyl-CoA dehydrogenase